MKSFRFVKRLSRTSDVPVKSEDSSKIRQEFNIKVKLVTRSKEKSYTSRAKFTPSTTISSSLNGEDIFKQSVNVYVNLSSSSIRKPDDFIEPAVDLRIPSANVFMQHRNLSEPVPEIVDIREKIKVSNKNNRICEKNPSIVSKPLKNHHAKSCDFRIVTNNVCKNYKIVKKPVIKSELRKTKQ